MTRDCFLDHHVRQHAGPHEQATLLPRASTIVLVRETPQGKVTIQNENEPTRRSKKAEGDVRNSAHPPQLGD